MKTLILSLALACAPSIPAFAEGAGPGCGSVKSPLTPFGVPEQGERVFVSWDALEKTFASLPSIAEPMKIAGAWSQILAAPEGAKFAEYRPEAAGEADGGIMILAATAKPVEPSDKPVPTPFGPGGSLRPVLSSATFRGPVLGREASAEQTFPIQDGVIHEGLLRGETVCRMPDDSHLLCRRTLSGYDYKAGSTRKGYFGFMRRVASNLQTTCERGTSIIEGLERTP